MGATLPLKCLSCGIYASAQAPAPGQAPLVAPNAAALLRRNATDLRRIAGRNLIDAGEMRMRLNELLAQRRQRVERQRLAERYHLDGDYLLYAGGLDLRKNVTTLIHAYAQSGVTTPLAIAGAPRSAGSQFPDLPAVARGAGVADRVRFLGWVEEDDKPALYRHCQAFAFPSRYEGFGLPVIEAMQLGVPVLTSNTSSRPSPAAESN